MHHAIGRLSRRGFNDLHGATTGADRAASKDVVPEFSYNDPALFDVIDAPRWVPTGSHRAGGTDGMIIWGEIARPAA